MANSAFLRTVAVGFLVLAFPISATAGKIYWVTDKVKRANLDGTGPEDIFIQGPYIHPLSIAVDPTAGKVFWVQSNVGIMRANLDGTVLEDITPAVLVDQNLGGLPEGIAYYASGGSGQLYVTTNGGGGHPSKVFRIDLVTMQAVEVLSFPGYPQQIAVNSGNGRIYWKMGAGLSISSANLDGSKPQQVFFSGYFHAFAIHDEEEKFYLNTPLAISRCNFDGSEFEELVSGLNPNDPLGGIAVDTNGGKIHWIRGGLSYRADLDGQSIETFNLQGTVGCSALAFDEVTNKLYLGDGCLLRITRVNSDGSDFETVLTNGYIEPSGLALDADARRYYWSVGPTIYRSDYDGSNLQVIALLSQVLHSLAVDHVGQKLYWTQEGRDIFRADLDGTNIEQIVTNVDAGAYGLAIDSINMKLYWTPDRLELSPLFSRSNLDGSDIEQFIDIYYAFPLQYMDIALDVPNGKVYMTRNQGILRCNLDATNIEELIPIAPITDTASRLALDLDEQHIYWTNHFGIHRADFDGLNLVTVLPNQDAFNGLALDTTCVTQFYGDVNTSGAVDLDDILCTLRAFSNISICTGADLSPCSGNGLVNLDDILAQLGAFSGNGACPDLCN